MFKTSWQNSPKFNNLLSWTNVSWLQDTTASIPPSFQPFQFLSAPSHHRNPHLGVIISHLDYRHSLPSRASPYGFVSFLCWPQRDLSNLTTLCFCSKNIHGPPLPTRWSCNILDPLSAFWSSFPSHLPHPPSPVTLPIHPTIPWTPLCSQLPAVTYVVHPSVPSSHPLLFLLSFKVQVKCHPLSEGIF